VAPADAAHAVPSGPAHWTCCNWSGTSIISIGLTRSLVDSAQDGRSGETGQLLIADRSQVAPIVYDYAVAQVKETAPADALADDPRDVPALAGRPTSNPPDTIGSGFFALMRLDDFVATRIVEAVIHGMT